PAIRPGPDDVGILEHDGGFLAAERCVAALAARAQARGARIRAGERVLAVEVGDDAVHLRTDRGEIVAEKLGLAQAAWGGRDASVLRIPVPLSIERQVQLWFRPRAPELFAPGRMPVFIHFRPEGDFYGIPAGGAGVKVCEHHGGVTTRAELLDREV